MLLRQSISATVLAGTIVLCVATSPIPTPREFEGFAEADGPYVLLTPEAPSRAFDIDLTATVPAEAFDRGLSSHIEVRAWQDREFPEGELVVGLLRCHDGPVPEGHPVLIPDILADCPEDAPCARSICLQLSGSEFLDRMPVSFTVTAEATAGDVMEKGEEGQTIPLDIAITPVADEEA